jgi:hypothetical protein
MKKKEEPKLWVTVLWLAVGVVVIIGLVGLALWYAGEMETDYRPAPKDAWGIANDSPLKNRR